jgi:hypothetical protein
VWPSHGDTTARERRGGGGPLAERDTPSHEEEGEGTRWSWPWSCNGASTAGVENTRGVRGCCTRDVAVRDGGGGVVAPLPVARNGSPNADCVRGGSEGRVASLLTSSRAGMAGGGGEGEWLSRGGKAGARTGSGCIGGTSAQAPSPLRACVCSSFASPSSSSSM